MSFYISKNRAMFLHIPRTGGTTVGKVVRQLGLTAVHYRPERHEALRLPVNHCLLPHYSPQQLIDVDMICTFVRHPIAYYESIWKWMAMPREPRVRVMKSWRWHPTLSAWLQYSPDFNEWVWNMLRNEPAWYSRLLGWYVGPQGGEYVNWIGRTESLDKDFRFLLSLWGVEDVDSLTIPRENSIQVKLEWEESLKKDVLSMEAVVVRRFYCNRRATRKRWYRHVDRNR
jgi:hypothetical protein